MPKPSHRLLRSIALAIPLLFLAAAAGRSPEPSLLVYDFNLDLGPAGNVDHVESLGFDGIVTGIAKPADVIRLEQYAAHVHGVPDFQLLGFVQYDFTNPDSPQVWRDALPTLASVKAPLWVIVKNSPSVDALRLLLAQMAADSQTVGIEAVIYPHYNTDIDSAAEAAALIREIGHPNLKNSLHTCHEIRAGNQYSLQGIAAKNAHASSLVTIAGAAANASTGTFPPPVGWGDAIKPLDKGAFSLLPFLQGLHDAGYSGSVILHTFGITGDPGHLERSLRKYGNYLDQVTL